MSKPSSSPEKREKVLKLIALILVIGAVVVTVVVAASFDARDAVNAEPSEQLELSSTEETPENTSDASSRDSVPDLFGELGNYPPQPAPEGLTEEQVKEFNNPLFIMAARTLIEHNELFRQTLILATVNMAQAFQGGPLYTEEDLPMDLDDELLIGGMSDFLQWNDDYRNHVLALIMSSLTTEQRQYLAKELEGDPALSDPEVVPLIPDDAGNYPNYSTPSTNSPISGQSDSTSPSSDQSV